MVNKATYRTSLSSYVQNTFKKIFEEAKAMESSTQGKLDLLCSVNGLPTEKELKELLKTSGVGGRISGDPKLPVEPTKVPPNLLQIRSININGQDIQLADYGEVIIANISSAESFEDLITSMAEHWKPNMYKLMLRMTQTFVEAPKRSFG
ncbi:uncharacterized protein LOC117591664 [Drosophila guanche]|uniref:uncharacterized protein LOC117591664 n=1 Tax=Drosophila guanche TaxID=7266 RepID=UPI001470BBEE|nr:uncharacterized protein LOC117591664 [Drosophila guanche]